MREQLGGQLAGKSVLELGSGTGGARRCHLSVL
jgi:hypothetical protein